MKPILSLIAVILLPLLTWSQSFDAQKAVTALHNEGLVSDNERDSLVEWLQHPRVSTEENFFMLPPDPLNTPEGLLGQIALFRTDSSSLLASGYYNLFYEGVEMQELLDQPASKAYAASLYGLPVPGKEFYSYDIHAPVADSVAARNLTLAKRLQRIGLLGPEVVELIPSQKDIEYAYDLYSSYNRFANLTRYHRNYALLREAELRKARNLVESGILSEEAFKHLQLDYKPNQLMGDCGLAGYSSRGLLITEESVLESREAMLTQIGQQLLAKMPLQGGTHLRVQRENLPYPDGHISYDTDNNYWVAYVDYQGKTYAQAFFLPESDVTPSIICFSDFRHLFNKVLSDAGSDYRLHSVEAFDLQNVGDPSRGALIYLTESQQMGWDADIFSDTLLSMLVPYTPILAENFTTEFSPSRVQGIYSELESVGFLSHLTEEEKKACWDLIWKSPVLDEMDLLMLIPGTLLPLPYYYTDPEKPYIEILGILREFTHGKFNATKIVDGSAKANPGQSFTVSFKVKKKHKLTLEDDYDMISTGFYEEVVKASEECDSESRLYFVQGKSGMAFLTNAQYQTLLRLCPDLFSDEYYFEGE